MKETVIVSATRTAMGAMSGGLAPMPASKLGAVVIAEAIKRAGIDGNLIDEVIMGNVLMGGQGQAPARQAAIYAGLPQKVECMTINKVCGSGAKSVALADQAIKTGDAEIIVAGGMESMTNAPYALKQARAGFRMGDGEVKDLMIYDGLWDPYGNKHMGNFGDLCSAEKGIGREEQDVFATESYRRAIKAQDEGWFKKEIVPVEVPGRRGAVTIFEEDESPRSVRFEKIPQLRPAFNKDGAVTAANASSINDGAAAMLMMSREKADELGLKPLARVVAHASHAEAPEWFTIAPVGACNKALEKAGMAVGDIDLWEINEAFSVVTMYAMQQLGISHDIVNVHGGAAALGHPIGASGTRLLVTLLHAMEQYDKTTGAATLCIGGGEGITVILERI